MNQIPYIHHNNVPICKQVNKVSFNVLLYCFYCCRYICFYLRFSFIFLSQWSEVKLQFGHQTSYSVYQACNSAYKTTQKILWSTWIPRRHARHLFIDLLFAQEVESPSSLSPLDVYLVQSDTPLRNFKIREYSTPILKLWVAQPFQDDETIKDIQQKISQRQGLDLGQVSQIGFHLGFSYSGPCLFLGSVQVYFMKCPGLVEARVDFAAVAGESGLVKGACVQGSVETSPPQRQCQADGQWGALHGHCICAVGHQQSGESCEGSMAHFLTLLTCICLSHKNTIYTGMHKTIVQVCICRTKSYAQHLLVVKVQMHYDKKLLHFNFYTVKEVHKSLKCTVICSALTSN